MKEIEIGEYCGVKFKTILSEKEYKKEIKRRKKDVFNINKELKKENETLKQYIKFLEDGF